MVRWCDSCTHGVGSPECERCLIDMQPFRADTSLTMPMPSQWIQRKNDEKEVKKEVKEDLVNHPKHYKSKVGLEAIDVIEAFTEDLEGIEAVCTANVIKYICRWKRKNGLQDLEKAEWYLKKLIKKVKGEMKDEN